MNSPHPTTPLRVSMISETRLNRCASVTAIVGLVVFILLASIVASHSISNREEAEVAARTERAVVAIDDRMSSYIEVLFGIRNAFNADPELSRATYHNVVERLAVDERLPGVQVIGAAHLLDAAMLPGSERIIDDRARWSGLEYPTFEVHPLTGAAQVLPIDYLEPQLGNEAAFGLDFLSEPNRQPQRSGSPVSSRPRTGTHRHGARVGRRRVPDHQRRTVRAHRVPARRSHADRRARTRTPGRPADRP